MKRSQAPSQSLKRQKFEPPFNNRPSLNTKQPPDLDIVVGVLPEDDSKNPGNIIDHKTTACEKNGRSTTDILKLLQSTSVVANSIEKLKSDSSEKVLNGNSTHFENTKDGLSSALSVISQMSVDQTNEASLKSAVDENDHASRYFNVMWCKLSKKKHKKWEGDAVLIVKGRTAILKDLEGKEIGRATGYKQKEIQAIDEGQMFFVGGKECEIQNEMPKTVYDSGACFAKITCENDNSSLTCERNQPSKNFVLPLKDRSNYCKKPSPVVKPRYSVDNPNAIVLPRPNQTHQWKHNVNHSPIVDVIIDPQLAIHLRPHQREGVVFLYECILGMREYSGSGAILADEMGLGKTLQCITLIWTLLKQGPYGGQRIIKQALVIAPSSLIKNWLQEFHKWLGREKILVYAVDQKNKVQNFANNRSYDVLLISYEMFVRTFECLEAVAFDIVICDEGHRLKNGNIKTSNFITRLPTRRRVVLTGTPIQNDLGEFYSIVEFCNPGIIGSTAMFKQVYENPIVKSQQPKAPLEDISLGMARAEELTRLTSMFVLRRTQDVINKYLPPKVEKVIMCQLSLLQTKIYKCILQSKSLRSCLSSYATMDGASHLACITLLKKLCNHPYLLYHKAIQCRDDLYEDGKDALYGQIKSALPDTYAEFEQIPIDADSGKLRVLSGLLKALHGSGSEKIVLVSGYKQTLDLLQDLCKRQDYSFLRLDGSTPTVQRQSLVDTFNSPRSKHFVFLLSSRAGGLGLNLIGASRIVLYDIDWNPATDLQAMARIWRDGQRRRVHIYRLLTAGTIEEKIYQRQITKQGISGTVMESGELGKVKFSLDDLKDLFSFQEDAVSTTHDLLQCPCNGNFRASTPLDDIPVNNGERSCQLGGQSSDCSKKNATMATLMRWDHLSGSNLAHCQDECLDASSGITFMFCNEVRNEPL